MLVGMKLRYQGSEITITPTDLLREGNTVMRHFIASLNDLPDNLIGEGTLESPYTISTRTDWLHMLHLTRTPPPNTPELFFLVEGRLLRVQTNNKYVTDWGEHPSPNPLINHVKKLIIANNQASIMAFAMAIFTYINQAEDLAIAIFAPLVLIAITIYHGAHQYTIQLVRYFAECHGSTNTPYPEIQGLFASNPPAATNTKQLLLNQAGGQDINFASNTEKANTVLLTACWAVAETCRNPWSWLTTLIIYNFMERGIPYGQANNKPYTWQKCIQDTEGNPVRNAQYNDVAATNWGGKHPMAHGGSRDEQMQGHTNISTSITHPTTTSKQKEVSLLIRWLTIRLQTRHPEWNAQAIQAKPQAGRDIMHHPSESNYDAREEHEHLRPKTAKQRKQQSKTAGNYHAQTQQHRRLFDDQRYAQNKCEVLDILNQMIHEGLSPDHQNLSNDDHVAHYIHL